MAKEFEAQVLTALEERGNDMAAITKSLQGMSAQEQSQFFNAAAQKIGLQSDRSLMTVTPDKVSEMSPYLKNQIAQNPQGELQRGQSQIIKEDLGAPAAIVRGYGNTALLGHAENAGAAVQAVTGDKNFEVYQREQQERTQALQTEHPIAYTVGEILGFLTPQSLGAKLTSGVGKGVSALFGNISNPTLLRYLGRAFVTGAAEMGAFEGAQTAAKTGDFNEAIKAGAKGAAAGGITGAAIAGGGLGINKLLSGDSIQSIMAKGIEKQGLINAAEKRGEQVDDLSKKILSEDDPQILAAIKKQPERIKELVDNGTMSSYDIGSKLQKEFSNLKDHLVKKVGNLKEEVRKDTTPSIDTKQFKDMFQTLENKLTTSAVPEGSSKGISVLSSADKEQVNEIKNLMFSNKISPSDAILITDKIDSLVTYGERPSSNISALAQNLLKDIRRQIKNRVHLDHPEYSKADDNLQQFFANSELVKSQITNNPEQFVNRLFGQGKTQVRKDLMQLVVLANRIDPKSGAKNVQFARDIFNMKVAGQIKEGLIKKADPTADRINRIRQRYTAGGATIGAGIGAKFGGPYGAAAGAAGGGVVGDRIGQVIGNPMRILNAAIRSKQLTQQAKKVAVDLRAITAMGGPEAFAKFIDQVPVGTKAAESLANFIIDNSSLNHSDILGDDGADVMKLKGNVGDLVDKSMEQISGQ